MGQNDSRSSHIALIVSKAAPERVAVGVSLTRSDRAKPRPLGRHARLRHSFRFHAGAERTNDSPRCQPVDPGRSSRKDVRRSAQGIFRPCERALGLMQLGARGGLRDSQSVRNALPNDWWREGRGARLSVTRLGSVCQLRRFVRYDWCCIVCFRGSSNPLLL